ncbi:hypothetical protein MMC21_007563 [Puttea exsequens]|nr:hypothetical protein [Puttea exsequens]
MSKGWDPSKARDWLLEEHEKRDTASRQATFTAATVDIIIEDADFLPPTLTLDYIRLRTLQSDFQDLVFRVACLRTLASTLTKLEYANSISRSSYNRLFALVSALTADGLAIHERTAHLEDVALEIVRKAYSICSIVKMPSAEDLAFAKGSLRASCERKNDVIDELKLSLSRQLHALVDREVNISDGLTPVQLMDHYVPQRLPLHRPNVTGEQKVLLCLARKIAHITILHWRVWAPLVYK